MAQLQTSRRRTLGLITSVNIAPAGGRPAGKTLVAAEGLHVTEYATGFNHPRWLYVLPNGHVLVAESNALTKMEASFRLRGWVMGLVMSRVGSTVPSANQISLIRGADSDGVAKLHKIFLRGLNFTFV